MNKVPEAFKHFNFTINASSLSVKTSTSDVWLYKSGICLTNLVEGYLVLLMLTNRQVHRERSWQCYDCDNKWQTTMAVLFLRLLAAGRQPERE